MTFQIWIQITIINKTILLTLSHPFGFSVVYPLSLTLQYNFLNSELVQHFATNAFIMMTPPQLSNISICNRTSSIHMVLSLLSVTDVTIPLKSYSQRPDIPDIREGILDDINGDNFITHNKALTVYSSGVTDHKNLNPWIILLLVASSLCERTILLFLNDSVRGIQFAPIRPGDALEPLWN